MVQLPTVRLLIRLFCSILLISAWSCRQEGRYPYAIKDFRSALQPCLVKIVDKNAAGFEDSLDHTATDKELTQLERAENPLLRTDALRIMLQRKSFSAFDVVMNHLDDTATVSCDDGEFGIVRRFVSDDVLQRASWKTEADKNKTINEVLTRHNYLVSAYSILFYIHPQEKYYPYIKDMATRPRLLAPEGYELGFHDIELALYGLAKYSKKEDVGIIKGIMIKYPWIMTTPSFRILEEFPDTSYIDLFSQYFHRKFFNSSDSYSPPLQGEFIKALAIYRSDRSAALFDSILQVLPHLESSSDKNDILEKISVAVWTNPCPAYAGLMGKTKKTWEAYQKRNADFQITVPIPAAEAGNKHIVWNQ